MKLAVAVVVYLYWIVPSGLACFFAAYTIFRFMRINTILRRYKNWTVENLRIKGVDTSRIIRDLYVTDHTRDYIIHRDGLHEIWERIWAGGALLGTPVICLLLAARNGNPLWLLAGGIAVGMNFGMIFAEDGYRRQAHRYIALIYNLFHYTNICRAELDIMKDAGLSTEEKIKQLQKINRGAAFLPSYPEHEGIPQNEI